MSLKKVYLELTSRCNLNCVMCYRQSWSATPQDMDRELMLKISRELRTIKSMEEVVFGGIGEPTAAPFFCEAVEGLKDYRLTVTTNGVDLEDNALGSILRNVNSVVFSIDGIAERFAQIRGTELDKVTDTMKRLNYLKKQVGQTTPVLSVEFVLSCENLEDVYPLIDLASQYGVENLIISNLLPLVKENAARILYTRNENKEMRQIFAKVVNYSLLKGIKLLLPQWELKTERHCSFIENEAACISSTGIVAPCYRMLHTYKEFVFGREKTVHEYSFGDLREKGLADIWQDREYQSFRERVDQNKYPSCLDCDYVDGCDLVNDTLGDCYAGTPSCGDCLWARRIILCP